ncbi:TerD family protein [Streptomyces sp. NPDC094448]|uniref:TerD family protein n=1 Tax=Streptomyces sp. NPDC094448 TaxID=3366063 RepID=UPI0037FADEAD
MTNIPKGANVHVPHAPLRVLMGYTPTPAVPVIESLALLLDAGDRARSRYDLLHIPDQARHPSGAVAHLGRTNVLGILGYEDQVVQWDVILPVVEPEVGRILILATADGLSGGPVLGQVPGLYIQVRTVEGAPVARYDVTDAGSEKVLLMGEFYRRDGGWKFRAVGQGYASGLAGIVADYKRLGGDSGAAPAGGSVPQFAPPPYQAPQQMPQQVPQQQQQHMPPGPYHQQYGTQHGQQSGQQYDPYAPPAAPQQPAVTGHMRAPLPGRSYAPGHRIVDPVAPAAAPAPAPPFQVPQPPHQHQHQQPYQHQHQHQHQPPAPYPHDPLFGPVADLYRAQAQQPPDPTAHDTAPADPFARFPAFAPQSVRGSGDGAPLFPGPFPPGPILLEMVFRDRDTDWPVVHQLNQRREPANLLLGGECEGELVARAPAVAPDSYPLGVKVMSSAAWTITALPLSGTRRLGARVPAHGEGSDVLSYHGPEARLEIDYRADPRDHESSMSLIAMGLDEIDMAEADFVDTDYLLTSAVGPFRQTVHLPGGTRLIQVSAKGGWTLTAHPHH